MKTFAEFLAESTELTGSQFPLLTSLNTRYNVSRSLGDLLAILNPALKAGTIANPVFQTAKSKLSTVNDAVREAIGSEYFHAGKYASVPEKIRDLDLTLGDPHHIPGKVKKLAKIETDHPVKDRYMELAREMTILVDAMASLKDNVTKRQPKADDPTTKPTYIPPMAAGSALHIVTSVLTTMTDDLKRQYADKLFDADIKLIEYRLAHPKTREEYMKSRGVGPDPYASLMAQTCDGHDMFTGNYTHTKPDFQATVRKLVTSEADYVQQLFLAKNVRKLASIIEAKGNLKGSPAILHLHVAQNGFSGEIRVNFEDGSEFTVRNQVVISTSIHGTAFYRFPTTFHDVKLPNGKRMPGQPSEEEMNEIFGKATA